MVGNTKTRNEIDYCTSNEFNNFIPKQRWSHVDISFTGLKDCKISHVLYHIRDVYDLYVECTPNDKCVKIKWYLPRFNKLNVYARNLGNNEIPYLDEKEDSNLIENLNLCVFSYFTYHKLLSLGYAFRNNHVINIGFLIGFVVTLIGIALVILLHFGFLNLACIE